jgi:hypothetical protein
MYFHASYTLSPAILHILPQHFTMVSPLERQLNIATADAEFQLVTKNYQPTKSN